LRNRPKGVKVLALSPGWVDTDEGEPTSESKGAMEFMASLFRNVKPDLVGRIQPEESVRDQLDVIGKFGVEESGRMVSQHGNLDWF
jgi:NAD(P)-dependent dehydrogenase (short-subunit alcohol dehydrogenase family)